MDGGLRQRLVERTAEALRGGAIHPIPTACELVEQGGVRFVVRVVSNLAHKPQAAKAQANPFLPYDPEMFVADVSKTHVALLNKFNVLDHHLLIVTREFEAQESPLTLPDFEALWTCMAEVPGLAFYNSGRVAGASQPHKHLQLVPLPLAPGLDGVPIEPALRSGALPFAYALARLDESWPDAPGGAARASLDVYRSMLHSLRAEGRPYNLLITRGWMLLVPRNRECFESISINALGFAGALLARNTDELERIRDTGPMTVLQSVADNRSDG